MTSTSEHAFLTAWIQTTNTPVDIWQPGFVFHETRKWALDFAIPAIKLAVEIEGGRMGESRHKSDKGYQEDTYKYNAAGVRGWLVLRFTTDMVVNDTFNMIVTIVEGIQRQVDHTKLEVDPLEKVDLYLLLMTLQERLKELE